MIVFVAFKNSIDWSDGRSYYHGVYATKRAAAYGVTSNPKDAEKLLAGDRELSAYFTIREVEVVEEEGA